MIQVIDTEKVPVKEVKKQQGVYNSFGESRQSFDKVGLFEVFNGDLILRGRHGERDHVYPIHRALERFWRQLDIYKYWQLNGFFTQCQEWRYVLQDFGHKVLEALAQRVAGQSSNPPPAFCDAKYMARLTQAVKSI